MDRPDHEPDSFDVIHAESTVRVIVHRPSDLLTTQRYVWEAVLSPCPRNFGSS